MWQQRLPDARIGIVHGKMGQKEIAKVMNEMADGEIDILVCTTIIETGIDIPNANTLIIENADNMGSGAAAPDSRPCRSFVAPCVCVPVLSAWKGAQ